MTWFKDHTVSHKIGNKNEKHCKGSDICFKLLKNSNNRTNPRQFYSVWNVIVRSTYYFDPFLSRVLLKIIYLSSRHRYSKEYRLSFKLEAIFRKIQMDKI